MSEKKKAGLKELSPIDIYKLLPKTNCKECGVDNCMAFATKIVNREIELDSCKPLLKPENAKSYAKLQDLLKPAVKEITVGVGDKAKKIGGKLVMYRHEFTLQEPNSNSNRRNRRNDRATKSSHAYKKQITLPSNTSATP